MTGAPSGPTLSPIGVVRSCFTEKFGTPRQPGLVPEATGILEIHPPYSDPAAFTGLKNFSHLWVLFLFDQADAAWRPTVRPPRLGGNERLGVFATRSPFRPNRIGLSAVRLERIEPAGDLLQLHVSGLDIVDGSPLLDIKPYVPYVDAITDAAGGFADKAPEARLTVRFDAQADAALDQLPNTKGAALRKLIAAVIAQDPRPAYHANASGPQRLYGLRLNDINVRWQVSDTEAIVLEVHHAPT